MEGYIEKDKYKEAEAGATAQWRDLSRLSALVKSTSATCPKSKERGKQRYETTDVAKKGQRRIH